MHQYRFGILLAALLGMLVYQPLIELVAPQLPPIAIRMTPAIILGWLAISAVYAVSLRRRAPIVALMLGLPLLVLDIVDVSPLGLNTQFQLQVLGSLFLGYIVVVLLAYIFRQTRISVDTICASLCIYLLLGIAWAFLYSLLASVQPGAFVYAHAEEQQMRFGSQGSYLPLYFSFVTMTTLGYGDIAPVSAAARSLALLQAVFGQLYLTVLVAWLVGLHVAHSRTAPD